MDTAQLYQKLLTDAIKKQMIILGPEITLLKAHNVPELIITEDGTVATLGSKPEETVTRFLEQFRDLSGPLVKKTMQPLLSAMSAVANPATNPQPHSAANSTQPNQGNTTKLEQQNIRNPEPQNRIS